MFEENARDVKSCWLNLWGLKVDDNNENDGILNMEWDSVHGMCYSSICTLNTRIKRNVFLLNLLFITLNLTSHKICLFRFTCFHHFSTILLSFMSVLNYANALDRVNCRGELDHPAVRTVFNTECKRFTKSFRRFQAVVFRKIMTV